MTVLHSGSNNKYSSNWMKAFNQGKSATPSATKAAKKAGKKSAKRK